ncbi:major capsid protein [Pedobacter jejuensis]|uniref:Major capsid protein n=1 Tax=Pedobacter jejuensis TaxID=1268550 RepID=A0A3N0BPK9_9SPHI|nr:major capsid protein [Pedobacter jejuensis]RNL50774.1 hypothetical protein D7004_17960 [Pedobacter jejuensis]
MIVDSIFGDLARPANIQGVLDGQLPLLFAKSKWRQYLDWGLPQTDLTFESIIGRSRIEAAASIVDPDAPAPFRSRGKLESLKGKIPTMKEAFRLNQSDYRKLKAMQNLPISDEAIKQLLIKRLDDDVTNAGISTDYRIDIMFYQGISTFTIDAGIINNPDGANLGTIPLLNEPYQKRGVIKSWDHVDNNADIFKDIEDTVAFAASKGRKFKEIWIDNEKWLKIKKNTTVSTTLGSFFRQTRDVSATLSTVNEYMVENGLPPFVLINERRNVEIDGLDTIINPFEKNNVVFIPDGKLGIVHNAIAIEEWEPIDGINYAKYDRALISKWRENNPWQEFTGVELNAFPALEAIDGIYIQETTTLA